MLKLYLSLFLKYYRGKHVLTITTNIHAHTYNDNAEENKTGYGSRFVTKKVNEFDVTTEGRALDRC